MNLKELENVLLDQIEKLNDDSIAEEEEDTKMLVDRSRAISELADNVLQLNRLKVDVVKISEDSNGFYNKYLGVEYDK